MATWKENKMGFEFHGKDSGAQKTHLEAWSRNTRKENLHLGGLREAGEVLGG